MLYKMYSILDSKFDCKKHMNKCLKQEFNVLYYILILHCIFPNTKERIYSKLS